MYDGGIIYKDYYIIADTHFGFEYELIKKGIYLKGISEKVFNELLSLCFNRKIYKIIFLGDFKHEIFFGRKYLKDIISNLKEYFEIYIIKGNHDGRIEEIYNGRIFRKISFGDILLTHGHLNIDIKKYRTIIIGHEHPYIKISDKKFQCYILSRNNKGRKIIILPAFNRYITGINILELENFSSPIFRRNFSFENSEIILRNGYYLNKLKNLL